ncbi:gamma carbonic anhydrase family protein [Hoeflea sp. YIM 152468]|uniref:gamma carbonic anhydrase family protein n=1 Tax=Hoeflea sp. YIM 152468 TaxID=3031759 RepID=UPI0023DBDE18|nr:gamma carbonic anhydrase family protein [Hoeflea sp. YIM 152468]MDF1610021.1 gamma carbonic anhydrase family protein [Hoeflea sp. YIM 152468]
MAIYSLDGKQPLLPDGFYFVAESAQVIGRVVLGEGAGIWFGAVLRGDNELITVGEGSNIQENCVLHTDLGFPLTIGKGCTIGHSAILHGCTIGNNSLVGMGATVLNGAKIGENCLIGAGALVTEGKLIPDNSLVVGSPARVIRTLEADAVAMLTLSASHYVENARRFSKGLERIG